MSAFEHDLTIRLGEPFAATILITADGTPTGEPVDISAATLTLTIYPLDGESDLLSEQLSPTAQQGEAEFALAATGTNSVESLAAHAERTLRYRVADGTGKSLARGWCYVAPARGAV